MTVIGQETADSILRIASALSCHLELVKNGAQDWDPALSERARRALHEKLDEALNAIGRKVAQ